MSGLASIGKTALYANYAALQTVGNNIANVNTPGYSRQTVQVADAPGQFSGSGYVGKGVDVTTIARSYDKFLTNQAIATTAVSASDSARQDKLTQLESVFPIGSSGIGYAAGELLNSFVDVSSNPADSSARQVVLSQAQDLSARFQTTGDQLASLQLGVSVDLSASVDRVNSLAKQVAALNQQIGAQKGLGQPPNQLLDQRDQLISQIASNLNVTTIAADDGSLGVFISGGQNLVLGATANQLKVVPDTFDPQKVALSLSEGRTDRALPADSLAGGSISGLLRFQNEDLTAANNLLGQLATSIAGAVNQQQALGLDLGQPASRGAPIFAVGGGQVLAAAGNRGAVPSTLTVTVADASRVQASDYELGFDGSNYSLTRLADKSPAAGSPFTPAQLAAGVQVDGVEVQVGAGAVAGDRFLLRPVSTAGQTLRTVLASTQGIAAASPFTGSVAVDNRGSASVASVAAVDPSYDRTLSTEIAFTSDSGDYSYTLRDAATGVATATGSGSFRAGAPITLNGYALNLAGVPKGGDRISVVPTNAVASNNGNALAFSKLATAGLVALTGGSSTSAVNQTVTDAYASAIANIGVRVQSGKTAASISGAVATQAETARANRAGVNLDEEAASLIQYQQSYQAAAKILQVAQSIFDTLLRTTGN